MESGTAKRHTHTVMQTPLGVLKVASEIQHWANVLSHSGLTEGWGGEGREGGQTEKEGRANCE